jgi:ComF family protein
MGLYTVTQEPARGLDRLLDLLFPPRCVACGAWGEWLCAACVATLGEPPAPRCPRCAGPSRTGGLCGACRRGPRYLTGLRSVAAHRTPLREAVHGVKYSGMHVLVAPLADILHQYWAREGVAVDAVLPVPLHPSRVRYRGYNQSALLGAAFARRAGLAYHEDWVVRARRTRSQVGLTPRERWENVWRAFAVTSPSVGGARILLVDDVMTTGATLEACAHALRGAGAAEVWALTLTRASRSRGRPPGAP